MKKDFTLRSNFDGLGLSVMTTVPEGRGRAVLQVVHGMKGHKERYLPMMEYLASTGRILATCMVEVQLHWSMI